VVHRGRLGHWVVAVVVALQANSGAEGAARGLPAFGRAEYQDPDPYGQREHDDCVVDADGEAAGLASQDAHV
jgi:hypothetical protein